MTDPMTGATAVPPARDADTAVLSIRGLVTEFTTANGTVRAVNGVSYDVAAGQTVGVVGESGSGKSVTVMSALGLLPESAKVVAGQALFNGDDLLTMRQRQLERIRGAEIGLIFQDPMTALNPVMTIGRQLTEGLVRHTPGMRRVAAQRTAAELLAEVGIPDPATRAQQYPHEFSGGMRQRAMIAMAMACRPKLLIADEPTTALDVTIQAQILDLLRMVQLETGSALIFITHDLGVIAEMAERVVVMYAGRVVEVSDVDTIFHTSAHPYTRALLESLPRISERVSELAAIPGQPPNPQHLPTGCSFRTRCWLTRDRPECLIVPELSAVGVDHHAACHFSHELSEPLVGS